MIRQYSPLTMCITESWSLFMQLRDITMTENSVLIITPLISNDDARRLRYTLHSVSISMHPIRKALASKQMKNAAVSSTQHIAVASLLFTLFTNGMSSFIDNLVRMIPNSEC